MVQSWDTAEVATSRADYSVCTTWGYHDGHWYLLDVLRFRASFLELKDRVRAHRNHWKPDLILVEEAGSGRHLIEDLRSEIRTRADRDAPIGYKIVPCKPHAAKNERWAAQAAKLMSGDFLFPREASWLEPLRGEITAFPIVEHQPHQRRRRGSPAAPTRPGSKLEEGRPRPSKCHPPTASYESQRSH